MKTFAQMQDVRAKAVKESAIESYFLKLARQYGCMQHKNTPFFSPDGWPDRLLIWPDGKGTTDWIELKRPVGGRFQPKQEQVQAELRVLGCRVETINTKDGLDEFFATRAEQLNVKMRKPNRRSASLAKLRKLQSEY